MKELGSFLGRKFERSIDSISANDVSYIGINAGDKKQLKDAAKDTMNGVFWAVLNGVVSLVIGVVASIVATVIYNNLP